MKKINLLLLLCIFCLLTGCSNAKKDNDFTKDFMPALETSGLAFETDFVSEKELHLIGANVDSFVQCIDLLKELGYTFDTSLNNAEESMINMQLWQGKNETYTVNLCLVLDLKDSSGASDYIRVNYKPLDN